MAFVLLFSVFVIATCGLIYELIAGALASYLLGDSITQFSTIIGVYLFSMGIGSYLSKFINRNLISVFIQVELLIALVGGFSAALLFASFEYISHFRILLYSLVVLTGTFVGLEIPLIMRILKDRFEFKDLVSRVFTFDYLGALLASLIFPLVLVPHLGLVRSAFLFGILNAAVALGTLYLFKKEIPWARALKSSAILVIVFLLMGFVYSDRIMSFSEVASYQDNIVYAKSTPYQRIVLTKSQNDLKLFLNGNLQFSAKDEYRYHESLVHVGLSRMENPENVLILGGGDGLAAREVLKYHSVKKIVLVDLDPAMTELFKNHEALKQLNESALLSPKIEIVSKDAYVWIRDEVASGRVAAFDFVVVDFPDPSNFSLGKLYSTSFYRVLRQILKPGGAAVVQSTSPYYAPKSFWIIDATLKSTGFKTYPYHTYVPSFGEWGFTLASVDGLDSSFAGDAYTLPAGLKFLNSSMMNQIFTFPRDMLAEFKDVSSQINKLNNQILVRTFEDEWSQHTTR